MFFSCILLSVFYFSWKYTKQRSQVANSSSIDNCTNQVLQSSRMKVDKTQLDEIVPSLLHYSKRDILLTCFFSPNRGPTFNRTCHLIMINSLSFQIQQIVEWNSFIQWTRKVAILSAIFHRRKPDFHRYAVRLIEYRIYYRPDTR